MSKERELLEEIIAGDEDGYFYLTEKMFMKIKELLTQSEQIEQEPVAWMYERPDGDFTKRTLSVGLEKNFDGVIIPLYTSPPKREPLSDERLRDLSNSINDYPDFGNVSVWQAFYISRLIEKAHGIGGGNE